MSYKLADGSCSTDYKIGDKFTHRDAVEGSIYELREDDGTQNPWFEVEGCQGKGPRHWEDLTPVEAKKHASTINQLRETIKQLEATIQELER
jgi:hypothetical protein